MSKKDSIPPLNLNLSQWRRDIKTFTDTTIVELSAITDSLSTELANPGHLPARSQREDRELTGSDASDDRLAKLKQRLAQKVKD